MPKRLEAEGVMAVEKWNGQYRVLTTDQLVEQHVNAATAMQTMQDQLSKVTELLLRTRD